MTFILTFSKVQPEWPFTFKSVDPDSELMLRFRCVWFEDRKMGFPVIS